jgi:F-type H+-transporting ATPase subunit c
LKNEIAEKFLKKVAISDMIFKNFSLSRTMRNFLIALIMLAAVLGPSIVIGLIGYASIWALGRNPSAAPKILLAMIVALVFAEATAIIALLVLFQLFGA